MINNRNKQKNILENYYLTILISIVSHHKVKELIIKILIKYEI